MKTIALIIFIFSVPFVYSQSIPSLPEYSILYRGYKNKIVVEKGCHDSIQVNSDNGFLEKSEFVVNGKQYSGYLYQPYIKNIDIIITKGFKSGKLVSTDSTFYRVKPFPSPKLISKQISKSVGVRLLVSLGPECPIGGVTFDIRGGELQSGGGIAFVESIIPGEAVSRLEIGKIVGVTLSVTNSSTGLNELISGNLEVVP